MHADIAGLVVAEQNRPLVEDLILREFPPIAPALHSMRFEENEPLSAIQEVDRNSIAISLILRHVLQTSCRIYSLQGFGHFLAEARVSWELHSERNILCNCISLQTAPSFTYNKSAKKFEGPVQKVQKEQDIAKANEEEEKKQVHSYQALNGSHTVLSMQYLPHFAGYSKSL